MKELSIEEKATAYDKAIERAKKVFNCEANDREPGMSICEYIFPELKESEDERIRKELLEHCKNQAKPYIQTGNKCPQIQSWIAWLEKQAEQKFYCDKLETFVKEWRDKYSYPDDIDKFIGFAKSIIKWHQQDEQKSFDYEKAHIQQNDFAPKSAMEAIKEEKVDNANKVEPKFKIEKDKWYVCIKDLLDNYANKAFRKGDTYLSTQDGSLIPSNSNVPFEVICPDTYFRDWTIEDAKDGDVLANWNNTAFIFKAIEDETVKFHIAYNDEKWDEVKTPSTKLSHLGLPEPQFEFHPATKEQRDLLFKKMKEAGYEWDAEKKELRKIENPTAWSEEDEKMHNFAIRAVGLCKQYTINHQVNRYSKLLKRYEELQNWLKSLRPQSTWKPSDEQMEELRKHSDNVILRNLYYSLKKLKR